MQRNRLPTARGEGTTGSPSAHAARQLVPVPTPDPNVSRRHSARSRLRRARRMELAGRVVAIATPVIAVGVLEDFSFAWIGIALLGWLIAVQSAYGRASNTLRPLGPGAPAAAGAAIGVLIATSAAFVLDEPQVGLLPMLGCALLVWLFCWVAELAHRRWAAPERRVLIVGWSAVAAELAAGLEGTGYTLVGVAVDAPTVAVAQSRNSSISTMSELPELIASQQPDIVVIALERRRLEPLDHLLDAAHEGFKVLEAPQFFEHVFGRVPVSDLPRAWFLGVLHLYRQPYSAASKRTFDVVVATCALVLTAPLLPLIALLTKTSRGPVLIRQVRIGEHGLPFVLRKFRTMHAEAEKDGEAVWSSAGDGRVTAVGRVLRAVRLDELPQLWNILRGEMSIVGPRPERPEFIRSLEARVSFWSRRDLVKPGLTGWAQIRNGYAADSDQALAKLSYDLWYLRHRSLLVDLAICGQTVGVLLRGHVHMTRTAEPTSAEPAVTESASGNGAVQSAVPSQLQ
jgi:exopolysaccharide biosynthesis polyprenyl glycosylphosphotransferase